MFVRWSGLNQSEILMAGRAISDKEPTRIQSARAAGNKRVYLPLGNQDN